MNISNTIINRLCELADENALNTLAQEIYSKYYDADKKELTQDISQVIAQRVSSQEEIFKVKQKVEELIKQNTEQVETETNLSPELKETGEKIVKILSNYGVKCSLVDAKVGPSITQYEIELEPGTRINEVTGLTKEIAMGLAVKSVAINPVEGKAAIGIQIPNKETSVVSLDSVLDKSEKSGVSVALGKDTNGNSISADILKMQHVLIGGSTGSGKSACINTMICSLIKQYSPDEVKLVLIDPKKVELSAYESLPHLLMPIVKDAHEASEVLKKMCDEMDRRFTVFEKVKVKSIEGYNKLVAKYVAAGNSAKTMPYIVVVIDELADLMQVAGKEVEGSIQRLTQLARAAGIHLIVATQRPSVDVVTGVIKSNIASRIAFATASGIDSRTILDQQGAEKLLGKGDMLFKPIGAQNAKRIQGAYVTDEEVEDIVNQVNSQYGSSESKEEVKPEEKQEDRDENYEKALEIARRNRKISASILQLEMHIPYSEATRLIQKMQDNGLIKSQKGHTQRKVDKKAMKEV